MLDNTGPLVNKWLVGFSYGCVSYTSNRDCSPSARIVHRQEDVLNLRLLFSHPWLQYLQAFFQTRMDDALIGRHAAVCLQTMRLTKVSARKYPPSTIEIAVSPISDSQIPFPFHCTTTCTHLHLNTQAVRNLNPLICRFYFLDGKAKAMGVDPSATAFNVIRTLADKIGLQNVDGWALYEVRIPYTDSHNSKLVPHTVPAPLHYLDYCNYLSTLQTQFHNSHNSPVIPFPCSHAPVPTIRLTPSKSTSSRVTST